MSISPDVSATQFELVLLRSGHRSRRIFGKGITVKICLSPQNTIWALGCLLAVTFVSVQVDAQETGTKSSRRSSRKSDAVKFPIRKKTRSLLSQMNDMIPEQEIRKSTGPVSSDVRDYRGYGSETDVDEQQSSDDLLNTPQQNSGDVVGAVEAPFSIKATVEPIGQAPTSVLDLGTTSPVNQSQQMLPTAVDAAATNVLQTPVFQNFSDGRSQPKIKAPVNSNSPLNYDRILKDAERKRAQEIQRERQIWSDQQAAIAQQLESSPKNVDLSTIADAINNQKPGTTSPVQNTSAQIKSKPISANRMVQPKRSLSTGGIQFSLSDQPIGKQESSLEGSDSKNSSAVANDDKSAIEQLDDRTKDASNQRVNAAAAKKEQQRNVYRQQLHRPMTLTPAQLTLQYVDDEGEAVPGTLAQRTYLLDFAGYQNTAGLGNGIRVGQDGFAFQPQCATWASPNLCYQPLYYEDANLERFGARFPFWQPAIAAVHFFGSTIRLPYMMGLDPPHECFYAAGYGRPGNGYCYQREHLVWSLKGASLQALLITGAVFALP